MQAIGIFSLASQQANWLTIRQRTIAENIAHENLPGFSAKDVPPFRAVLDGSRTGLAITNAGHMGSSGSSAYNSATMAASATDTGRPVSIETELMKTTEVRNDYELNTAVVRAFHRMILTAAKV